MVTDSFIYSLEKPCTAATMFLPHLGAEVWNKLTELAHSKRPVQRSKAVSTAALGSDQFHFSLIHGPNVPMQYCSLQHQTLLQSPVTSTTVSCFCFDSISPFFLELFLHSSPEAIGHLPTWGVHLSVSYLFAFSYCSWGSQGKNTEVVCHSLLQWTMNLYTVSKNKTRSWLWLRSWTPYCQIQN